jgi:predicted RNA-binding Zn-ribbon protein involved in translation (DUF1610 family)
LPPIKIRRKIMKIVNYKELYERNLLNEKNFIYAICECTLMGEGIELPRPEKTTYIKFKCPRCGKDLGIIAQGKEEKNYLLF